jgi:Restriction endonuclease
MPDGGSFKIGSPKDGVLHLDWNGSLHRQGGLVFGEGDHTWTRKYWYSPLGLEQYLDLVRRAVETRHRAKGDVELIDYDDDGAYIALRFKINTTEANLARAYDAVRRIEAEVLEVAEQAADEVGQRIAEIAARLSGWGSESLDLLVDGVESANTTDDKGRTLEELCSRLLSSAPGSSVTGRIRTETEEIDISVLNDSDDPRLRREDAIILVECKNWMGKCGKNEFVIFHQKLENRNQRCSLGFLISWNGFAETVTKEMLRGSREGILIVPLTGEDIREAVRTGDFVRTLVARWEKAVNT